LKNPRIEIDLNKIKHNTEYIVSECRKVGISVMGVTKAFCGDVDIASAMVDGGVSFLADSRLENIIKIKDIHLPKVMLRIPMQSEVHDVVLNCDYSLNSEIDTISLLSKESIKIGKRHNVILMIDLGDLREGIWYEDSFDCIKKIKDLDGIKIAGIGTNLTCYGGVIPSYKNLSKLIEIANIIENIIGYKLDIISGGNSSSLHLLPKGEIPSRINNLRVGEAILLGRETAYGNIIDNLYDDIFMLYGEIVEIKKKPSYPVGDIGIDAFGKVPTFANKGPRLRAILAMGRGDVDFKNIIPEDDSIDIIGGSSDHLILDIENSKNSYSVGDEVGFKTTYGSLLQSMTSHYVKKIKKIY
jgi:predicted amino acid racemase